jgi:predicted kinase|tara:strand:- start:112 stop:405 length:294 start_codon:yes stop_codon:yes gene_type:complete
MNMKKKQQQQQKKEKEETKPLAELVYIKAIEEKIEKRVAARYEQRIDHLVGANNELMKELEQWERVRKVDELAPDSLSPEESQIVRMPWLKEHHEKD